jgi:hypothetical protein
MLALARTMQPGLHRRPDLHRLIHSNTSTTATNSRSRIRKPTIFAIRRLIDTPPLQPLRPNPHSARATAIRSPSRFRPLEAFGRRPPEYVAPRQRPASETLHNCRRQMMSAVTAAFFESGLAQASNRPIRAVLRRQKEYDNVLYHTPAVRTQLGTCGANARCAQNRFCPGNCPSVSTEARKPGRSGRI